MILSRDAKARFGDLLAAGRMLVVSIDYCAEVAQPYS